MYIFKLYNVKLYISGHEHNTQYLKRIINEDYVFNQIIIGASSEFRFWEENYYLSHSEPDDMFDDKDIYRGELDIIEDKVIVKYYNLNNKLKYEYKIDI